MANLLEQIGQGLKIAGGVASPGVFQANVREDEQFRQIKAQRAEMVLQLAARAAESGSITPEAFQTIAQKYGVEGAPALGPSIQSQQAQEKMQRESGLQRVRESARQQAFTSPPGTQQGGMVAGIDVNLPEPEVERQLRYANALIQSGESELVKEGSDLLKTLRERPANDPELVKLQDARDSAASLYGPDHPRVKQLDAAIAGKTQGEQKNVQFVELPTGRTVNGKPEMQNYAILGMNEDGTPKLVPQGKPAVKGSLVDVNVGGMTPEAAAKTQLVDTALSDLDTFTGMILPGGKVDRAMVAGLNTPGFAGAPGTDSRTAYSLIYNAIEAKLRAQSGAAVPEIEVQREVARFVPSILDNDATIKSKLDRLRGFLKGTYTRIKGAGKPTTEATEPEVKSLQIETEVQGVPIYSDKEKEKRYQQWKKSQEMK